MSVSLGESIRLADGANVQFCFDKVTASEQGFAIDLPDEPPFGSAPLDLIGRSRVVAAGNDELCRRLADALTR